MKEREKQKETVDSLAHSPSGHRGQYGPGQSHRTGFSLGLTCIAGGQALRSILHFIFISRDK